jgi:hypothetical protein
MNREQLLQLLHQKGIRVGVFSLDGRACDECLRLEQRGQGWLVYYAERGIRTNERVFETEDEACRYILERLSHDLGAQEMKH